MNSNQLKLIAAAAMVADHIGYFIFPQVQILRIVGRLAFPIFSYFVLEGCHHSHNKMNYFLKVFSLGLVCMAAEFLFDGRVYGNILITFSLSIILLCELKWIDSRKERDRVTLSRVCMVLIFAFTVAFVLFLCDRINVDYGFYGVLVPAFAEILSMLFRARFQYDELRARLISLTGFAAGLVCTAFHSNMGVTQFYSLLALPLLLLYNGKRGQMKLGMFFYLFYPLHILLIQLTALVLHV